MGTEEAAAREQYLAVNGDRRLIYAFLSRMYEKEVSAELLAELSGADSPVLKIEASGGFGGEGLGKGFQMLSGYLKNAAGRDANQLKLELAVEYANLFLGVKKKPLHPSESVYRSKDRTMFQEPRDQVLHVYWKAGVDKVKGYTEPEDHIAIELQFMEYLCRRTVESLEGNRRDEAIRYLQIQKEFIDDHLAKWVPQFTKEILESAEVDFYKDIAYITDAFIELERREIPDLLDEARVLSGSR